MNKRLYIIGYPDGVMLYIIASTLTINKDEDKLSFEDDDCNIIGEYRNWMWWREGTEYEKKLHG